MELDSKHKVEIKFQDSKIKAKRYEAYREGHLMPSEVTDKCKQEFQLMQKKEKDNDEKRDKKEQGALDKTEPLNITRGYFAGKTVFVDSAYNSLELRQLLVNLKIVRACNRLGADALVVENPGQPGMRNLWSAVLTGAPLMTKSVVETLAGPIVQYHAALAITRTIWISLKFRRARPVIADLILQTSKQLANSKWKFIESDDTAAFIPGRSKSKAKQQFMALVTKAEAKDPCVCVCLCVYMYIYIYNYTYIYIHVHMCVRACMCV